MKKGAAMRLVVIGLTLALAASAPLAATAQAPVMVQPLAPGEVLLEVNALGFVTTRADRATLSFTITASGETEAAARTVVQQSIAEIRTMLHGQGIGDADIRIQPITTYDTGTMPADMSMTMDTNMSMAATNAAAEDMNATMVADDTSDAMANAVEAVPGVSANAQAEIVIRNVDRVTAIQSALMERGIFASGVTYAVNDDSVPRRQARMQATQKARADAETYAAALNMRVARVVRVTERLGLDLLGMAANESQMLTQIFSPTAMRANGSQVPTIVVVGVDFALAPR
jgi:uncharacterized protein YggE